MAKEKKHTKRRNIWNWMDGFMGDKVILIIALLLMLISVISVFSSTPLLALETGVGRIGIMTTQLKVVLVKPEQYENAREIADHLRDKRTVVLNLESTNKDTARRLLDFISGVAYAQDGKIKKVAVSTYIITPYNVDILGDLIDELENNGLYF